ncbi:MAG: haloacid dehalogenase type II [Phycisphaerales bacterium]|nr:MAG: haloacid dehalogenase type II [Phycisphaerales bacterium]
MLEGPYKLLTFDCYGTLIDWASGIRAGLSSLLDEAGAQATTDEIYEAYLPIEMELEKPPWRPYAEVLQQAVVQLGARFGFEVNEQNRHALVDSLPSWAPFPDTNGALKRLKAKYRLAVLSNIDRDLFARTSEHFDVEFDWVVTAEDVRAYKPALGHFERIVQLSGISPTEILHTAQSLHHDIVPCTRLGRACVWINRRGEADVAGGTPPTQFPNLAALADDLGA